MKKISCLMLAVVIFSAVAALAKTENGNDIALYLEEAKGDKKKFAQLVSESKGKNFYFRYLEIMDMKSGRENNRPYITLTTMEPSSYFVVQFTVVKPVSLMKLMEEPESKRGTAIAVTGQIASVDLAKEKIILNPVIVQTKDRLTPKRGREMLGEIDPSARYYSFTGADGKPVSISYADKDILPWAGIENPAKAAKMKEEIQAQYTKEEWAEYCLNLLEQRKAGKQEARADAARRAGIISGATNAPVLSEE